MTPVAGHEEEQLWTHAKRPLTTASITTTVPAHTNQPTTQQLTQPLQAKR